MTRCLAFLLFLPILGSERGDFHSDERALATALGEAAEAFLGTLDAPSRKLAQIPFADEALRRWHFVPGDRPGIPLSNMTLSSRARTHDLLRVALSSQGYLKTTSIMALELALKRLELGQGGDGLSRDAERYFLLVLGDPSKDQPWAFRFEGHHISLTFTVVSGLIAVTPHFLGANPHEQRSGLGAGAKILGREETLGRDLLLALRPEQRVITLIADKTPDDIILGPARTAEWLSPRGISAASLDPSQRQKLTALLEEYLNNLDPTLASSERARIEATGFEKLHFAWAGSPEPGQPHYYRLSGPTFVIEYDNVQHGANHVHTVWRDLQRDFGTDLLKKHREDHPHGR